LPRQVVITGLGPITPIGIGKQAFWQALRSGQSGIRRVDDRINLEGIDTRIGAPILDFDPADYADPRRVRRLDRSSQLALASAKLALQDAQIDPETLDGERTGVIAGTGIGGMETFEESFRVLAERGPRRVSPFFVPRMMPNAIAGEISIEFGLRGANFGVVSACASGAHAIGVASELIVSGLLDCAVAGGAEAVLLRITYAGFDRIGAISRRNDEPERASRPFDRDRDGFVLGEGAGFVFLETYDRAVARGAHIYGHLAGFGMTADAFHITAPAEDGDGARRAMQMALSRAQVAPNEVDYINAHGTSTLLNDRAESAAIKRTFGDAAENVKISSTKSQIGHLIGAAGSVETIATLLSMENGYIPATLNFEHPDPECDLDYTPESVAIPIEVALSNSFGFGGQNAALLFRKPD